MFETPAGTQPVATFSKLNCWAAAVVSEQQSLPSTLADTFRHHRQLYLCWQQALTRSQTADCRHAVLMHWSCIAGGFESGFDTSAGTGGGGQTREHAQLARSLGIEQLAVVISKLDTCDFSQQRFQDIQAQLLPFLKQCGFRASAVQWLPAVGPSGQNLVQQPTAPGLSWFKVSHLCLCCPC